METLQLKIKRIGDLKGQIAVIQSETDEEILRLKNEMSKKIKPLEAEIVSLSREIKSLCDTDRPKLFTDKKTLKLETGEVSYRIGKPSVATRSSAKLIEKILETHDMTGPVEKLRKKLEKIFLSLDVSLDKTAILKNPPKAKELIKVDVSDGKERFYIKPHSTDTELEVD